MLKPFDDWNSDKKRIDATEDYLPRYYKREVRWCRLGVNIGFEQDGAGEDSDRGEFPITSAATLLTRSEAMTP